MEEEKESTISNSPDNTEIDSPTSGVMPPPPVMSTHVSMGMERSLGGGGGTDGGGAEVGVEIMNMKKRGRPNEEMGFPISPDYRPSPSEFPQKRGRGRPPGSGKRQMLASLGGWLRPTAGWNFTPHILTINAGEEVVAKIFSFSQKGPKSICILSANGAVSNVTIRQPGSSGGFLTYEGRFELLSLSGSFTPADGGGGRSRTGGLSVSLAGPDGRVIGGCVAGILVAASPIQMVVGSFMSSSCKMYKKKQRLESSTASAVLAGARVIATAARPVSQATPEVDNYVIPTSALPEQNSAEAENIMNSDNPNPISLHSAGRLELEPTLDPKPSPDINVCVPGG